MSCAQSLAVSDTGIAYSWGWGESGSTGHGERAHCLTPTPIAALVGVRIVQASAGSGHSLFVSEGGTLFACGDCRYGKLGLGKITEDALVPQRVTMPSGVRVRHASAWHAHSLCVSTTGALYSFGNGERGRLGHGDERPRWRPNLVKFFSGSDGLRVRCAAAGELHSCVLTDAGCVYAFGDCSLGQTGHDVFGPLLTPTCVRGPLAMERVAELAVGDHHTLVRTVDGSLLAFGKNLEGQLGLGRSGYGVWTPSRVRWE